MAQDLEDQVVFLTDDLEAREVAKDIGIEVHGSVGVISRFLTTVTVQIFALGSQPCLDAWIVSEVTRFLPRLKPWVSALPLYEQLPHGIFVWGRNI